MGVLSINLGPEGLQKRRNSIYRRRTRIPAPAIFYKFYFMQTEHPGMLVSVPAASNQRLPAAGYPIGCYKQPNVACS